MSFSPPNLPAGLPANVCQVLSSFLASAQRSLADDLLSAVLFGSAAEGALRKSSDVNLILILRRYDSALTQQLETISLPRKLPFFCV